MQIQTALPEAAPSRQSKETDLEVGRWGEELVYCFLLQRQKGSDSSWQVDWVNEAYNTGTPYDIHLRQDSACTTSALSQQSLPLAEACLWRTNV